MADSGAGAQCTENTRVGGTVPGHQNQERPVKGRSRKAIPPCLVRGAILVLEPGFSCLLFDRVV